MEHFASLLEAHRIILVLLAFTFGNKIHCTIHWIVWYLLFPHCILFKTIIEILLKVVGFCTFLFLL
jgi:hypothetical protein